MARRPFDGPNPNISSHSRKESYGFRASSKSELKAQRNKEKKTPKLTDLQDFQLYDGVPTSIPRRDKPKR